MSSFAAWEELVSRSAVSIASHLPLTEEASISRAFQDVARASGETTGAQATLSVRCVGGIAPGVPPFSTGKCGLPNGTLPLLSMKHLLGSLAVLFGCYFLCGPAEAQLKKEDFLIDPLKPFVYLEMNHVGPRKPLSGDEPKVGIWLSLINNCRLPIVVIASETSDERTGEPLWVADEVVPDKPSTGTESTIGVVGYRRGEGELADIFIWPNTNEAEVIGAEHAARAAPRTSDRSARPHGYNDGHEPGAQVLRVIPPGQKIVFSVPNNHVAEGWHFQIPFRLALPSENRTRPPYSFVAFFETDLKNKNEDATKPQPLVP